MNSIHFKITHTPSPTAWAALNNSSATTSYFQTKACYEFYGKLSFLEPFVYAVQQGDELQALVCGYIIASKHFPASYFSRRAIIPGGVLVANNCQPEALSLLLTHLKTKLSHKAIYIEMRNFNDYSPWKSIFEQAGFAYQTHYNVQNSLIDKDTLGLTKQLAEEKQRQLKKSEAQGVSCALAQNKAEIVEFYGLLAKFYQKEIRLPLFPLEFFVNLHAEKNADILLVKHNNAIIGGIVLVHDPTTAYEWFVCGDKESKLYPSVVATAKGILHAQKLGLQKFDFMGAGNENEKQGVRNFKLRFGGELVEHGRFLCICQPILYATGKKAIQLITKQLIK
jgi:serine/alanine adding enzyme